MSRFAVLVLAGWAMACTPARLAPVSADHPASESAAVISLALPVTALPAVSQPELPRVLRPGESTTQPAPGVHALAAGTSTSRRGLPQLGAALDAYLGVQTALAADDLGGATAGARTLAEAFAALTATAPEEQPHFWHARAEEVETVLVETTALEEASDLFAARLAFGHLSPVLAGWVEVLGAPDGYDLARFACGMFGEAPRGGVWLQQGAQTQNPYFGTAMLLCGAKEQPIPTMTGEAEDKGHSPNHDAP